MARGKGRLGVQELWSGLPEWLPLPAGRLIPAIIQDAASGMVLMLGGKPVLPDIIRLRKGSFQIPKVHMHNP